MPINLQNHRTSNAKLFSVSSNKQKLHTAASLKESQKNNLKVLKNDSGSGFAMMTRMFANPTNATPNLPAEIPARNCRQRRHSISTNSSRTPDHSPAPSLRHSTNSTPHQRSSSNKSSSRQRIKRSESLDTTLVFQQQLGNNNKESTPNNIKGTKTRPRRSRSFGNPISGAGGPVIKSLGQSPPRRKLSPRRGSGDTSKSANHADAVCPPSPRDTLRAKREQLRRKSHGGISVNLPNLPSTQQTPASLLGGDDDDNSMSDDSLLSGSS